MGRWVWIPSFSPSLGPSHGPTKPNELCSCTTALGYQLSEWQEQVWWWIGTNGGAHNILLSVTGSPHCCCLCLHVCAWVGSVCERVCVCVSVYFCKTLSQRYCTRVLLKSVSLGVNAILDLWPYKASRCSRCRALSLYNSSKIKKRWQVGARSAFHSEDGGVSAMSPWKRKVDTRCLQLPPISLICLPGGPYSLSETDTGPSEPSLGLEGRSGVAV